MSSSTLDPDNAPFNRPGTPQGHDTRTLGPSDTSDSGSDMAGPGPAGKEPGIEDNGDVGFDRIVNAGEAGLGGGLDQAEEAQLGLTDEELAREMSGYAREDGDDTDVPPPRSGERPHQRY